MELVLWGEDHENKKPSAVSNQLEKPKVTLAAHEMCRWQSWLAGLTH
jgi:hypothetical protein